MQKIISTHQPIIPSTHQQISKSTHQQISKSTHCRIAIVGCGLIGQKRAKALCGHKLVACADADIKKAEILAKSISGCIAIESWEELIKRKDIDIVVVAVNHVSLPEITFAAVDAKKHVLVEKPAARRAGDLDVIIKKAKENNVLVHVGFNHRYHRAFFKAKELVESGAL